VTRRDRAGAAIRQSALGGNLAGRARLPGRRRRDRRILPQLLTDPALERTQLRPCRVLEYLGGVSLQTALATASRASHIRRATSPCERPSTNTNRRISAHCCTSRTSLPPAGAPTVQPRRRLPIASPRTRISRRRRRPAGRRDFLMRRVGRAKSTQTRKRDDLFSGEPHRRSRPLAPTAARSAIRISGERSPLNSMRRCDSLRLKEQSNLASRRERRTKHEHPR
jgi:hypothetical protein